MPPPRWPLPFQLPRDGRVRLAEHEPRDRLRIVRQRHARSSANLKDRAGQISQQLRAPLREAGFLASAHEAVVDRGHQPGHSQLSMVTMWTLSVSDMAIACDRS